MISRRAALGALVFAVWTGKALRSHAAASAEFSERFQVLAPPQPVATGDQVEVIEFFWYGCPYCLELQPLLQVWLRRRPADTAFRRIPAIRREGWAPHARIYHALAALGEVERLHQKVYDAYPDLRY
jgi:thiol:disulfide interchange protein DsbA